MHLHSKLARLAVFACVSVSLLLVFIDSYTSSSCQTTPAGDEVYCFLQQQTIIEDRGWIALLLLAAPISASVAILLAVQRLHKTFAWATVTVFFGFAVITGLSVGLFYIPTALISLGAAITMPRRSVRLPPAAPEAA